MKYILGIAIPISIQLLLTAVVILANTGNGSWLGLGALFLAIFAVPTTAIFNAVVLKNSKAQSIISVFFECFLSSVFLPIVMVFMLAVS